MVTDRMVLLVRRFVPNSKWKVSLLDKESESNIIVIRNDVQLFGYRVSPSYLLWELYKPSANISQTQFYKSPVNTSETQFITPFIGGDFDKDEVQRDDAYTVIGLSLLRELELKAMFRESLRK